MERGRGEAELSEGDRRGEPREKGKGREVVRDEH